MATEQPTSPAEATSPDEWREATYPSGKPYQFVPRIGTPGTIHRRGSETVEAARLRDSIETEAKRERQRAEPSRPKGKGRRKDPKPTGAQKPSEPPKPTGPSADQLAAAVELPVVMLATFYSRMVLQCDYCANNSVLAAPQAARDIATYAERNAYLRSLLVWWHALVSGAAGAEGVARLVGIPLLHHAAPPPVQAIVGPILAMPPKPPPSPHTHRPSPQGARPGATESPAPQTPPRAPGGGDGRDQPPPPPMPTLTPEQAAELARERDAARRVQSARELGARQAAAAVSAVHGRTIPPYRAENTGPTPPPTPPGADAGSPLPPEAGIG